MRKFNAVTPAQSKKTELQDFFQELSKNDVYSGSSYSVDKKAIRKVFDKTSSCAKEDILIRLTMIDSMYSTQMSRRYYALDELADALTALAKRDENRLKNLFLEFAENPEASLSKFDYKTKEKSSNLFSENYGIGKDGNDKGVAISLISKYAYFETEFQFPIYDSIVCEMYPLVWTSCGFGNEIPKLKVAENGKIQGGKTLVQYVESINLMIKKFGVKNLDYNILDIYLWFVGKILRGNLSLVLSREEYEATLKVTKEVATATKNGKVTTSVEYFNIQKVNLSQLKYLKDNPILNKFFEFAKFYSMIRRATK